VEAFEAPPSEPLISLSDVLAGVGWLAYHGARLTFQGAKLAYEGGSALAKSIQESRNRPLTLPEIDAFIDHAPDAGDALRQLAGTPSLELPVAAAQRWQADFSVLAPGDKEGLKSAMHRLVGERQVRHQTEISRIAADCCLRLGFQASTLRPEHGVLVARKGRETLTVVTERRKDGGVALHFDADGFHGDACVRTLNALQKMLEEQGVRFRVSSRRRKDDHRAIDARRLGSANHLRHRG
jgi:hypothetical protein